MPIAMPKSESFTQAEVRAFPHVSEALPLVIIVAVFVVRGTTVEHWFVPTFARDTLKS